MTNAVNDRSSPLALLRTRRSVRPRDLVEPGPNQEQLSEILRIALRTPDHGKLTPWRLIHIDKDDRAAFASLLHRAWRVDNPEPGAKELEAIDRFAYQAPCLIVVLSSSAATSKIPLWEQELSCGALCMNLLHAAHAMGFAAGWITGWAAYSPSVCQAFAHADNEQPGDVPTEKIAGFIYIGTAAEPPEERPRPTPGQLLSRWPGNKC